MRKILLGVFLLYPIVIVVIFRVTFSRDPFAIFDEFYLALTSLAVPVTIIFGLIVMLWRNGWKSWFWTAITATWVMVLTVLHFWVVMQIAASV